MVTTTLPEQTPPKGSVAVIEVGLQLTIPIGVLPITTVPLFVKLLPAIITLLPGTPLAGDMLEIAGKTPNVYDTRFDVEPQLLVTSILPEQTPFNGRVAIMVLADQLTMPSVVLPILTLPLLVKLLPAITTLLPGVPLAGATLDMNGTTESV